ncbi:hypothetical protein D7243_22915 [Stutzerimonas stutzeri]|nr:hypothetical protein [Stutzerimonas stutzeri]
MSKEVKRYDALRDAAKKATPGPWRIEDDEDSAAGAVYITQDTPDWREPIARLYGWHDQNYLELADTTTILELLAERDALLAERDWLMQDAARYRYLRQHLLGVSFDWNGEGITALEFEMPAGIRIGADCDKNIDAALQGAQP